MSMERNRQDQKKTDIKNNDERIPAKDKKEDYLKTLEAQQESQLCKLQVMNERLRKLESQFITTLHPKDYNLLMNQNHSPIVPPSSSGFDQSPKEELLQVIRTALNQDYPQGTLLYIYMWGSRFLGIADRFSDWDFVVVMSGIEQRALDTCTIQIPEDRLPETCRAGGVDIAVYNRDFWQSLLNHHESWVLPFWYDYPQDMIWYQVAPVTQIFSFKLSYLQLKHSIFQTISTNWGQTRSFYISGSVRKAKKRIAYSAVALYHAIQILQKGTIFDRLPCKKFFEMILFRHFSSWEQFFQQVNDEYIIPLTKQFKSLVNASRRIEQYVSQNILPSKADPYHHMFDYLIHFTQNYSFDELESYLSIVSVPHPEIPELIQLDSQYPYYSSPTSMACNSVLIHKATKQIVGAANSFTPEWTTLEKFCKRAIEQNETTLSLTLDWNNGYTCYEDIDGTPVLFFYFEGRWIVSKVDLPPFNYVPNLSSFNSHNSNNLSDNNPNIRKSNQDINCNNNNIFHNNSNHSKEEVNGLPSGKQTFNSQEGQIPLTELFWSIWKSLGYQLPNYEEDQACYVFKLVHPALIHFTSYERPKDLLLYSVRKLGGHYPQFEPKAYAEKYGWHTASRTFTIKKAKLSGAFPTDWVNAVEGLHPIECKGFLFVGANQRRLKLTSPAWKSLKKLATLDPYHPETLPVAKEIFFELILGFPDMGELLVTHFPPCLSAFYPLCQNMVLEIQALTNEIQIWFDQIKDLPDYPKLVHKYDYLLPAKYLKPLREGKQFKNIRNVLSYFYSKTFSKSYKKQVQKWGRDHFASLTIEKNQI